MLKSKEDCPQLLVKAAKTKWQKLVASEMVDISIRLTAMEKDMKWLKWMSRTTFGVTLSTVALIIVGGLI